MKQKKKKVTPRKSTAVKRKHVQVAAPDVGLDILDIEPPRQNRKTRGKKIPPNVPTSPLDNISFHSEKSVLRWKFVYQRRIARERELHGDVLKCKEIINLLQTAGLMKTVTK